VAEVTIPAEIRVEETDVIQTEEAPTTIAVDETPEGAGMTLIGLDHTMAAQKHRRTATDLRRASGIYSVE
jgi:hypothetical protein